jgi:hypothetical protein
MQIVDQHALEQHSCECHSMLSGYVSKLLDSSTDAVPAVEVSRVEAPVSRRVL